jgi:IPT/TIG domain/Bacterial Ig-like domain (group 2)
MLNKKIAGAPWCCLSASAWFSAVKLLFVVLILMPTLIHASPQSQPALQITAPAAGIIVSPGQTLSVTVISPNGTTFSEVALLGPDPIGFNVVETSVPAQFSIAIPADASCRVYSLTADGITSSGQSSTSAPIQIDIEWPDLPISLSTPGSDEILILESLGMDVPLKTLATFADGTILDVSESTLLSYNSTNTAVVTVDAAGRVTAIGAGSAAVSMIYTQGGKSVQLTLQARVLPQDVAVSLGSLTFSGQPTGTTSAAQAVTLTNSSSGSVGILALRTTGDFSETDGCVAPSPLSPGSSCTANVTFSPKVAGARTGTLSIANSANVVPISISLSGTGTNAPDIISLSPTSGAVGSSVTITGTNFGASQGTSTVTFNGTAATPSWSATSIAVPVPSGATTGNVLVTVGGHASNGVSFTVTGTPPRSIALVQHATHEETHERI